jgi:hypothetical protein
MVAAPANTPISPIHPLRRVLLAIATPKITATLPWRIRKMLLILISVHLIPSATRKVMAFSSAGAAVQESTALLRAIPSTA